MTYRSNKNNLADNFTYENVKNVHMYLGAIMLRHHNGEPEVLVAKYSNRDTGEGDYNKLPGEPSGLPIKASRILKISLARKLEVPPSKILFCKKEHAILFNYRKSPSMFMMGKLSTQIPSRILNNWHPTSTSSHRKLSWVHLEDALNTASGFHQIALLKFKTKHHQASQRA